MFRRGTDPVLKFDQMLVYVRWQPVTATVERAEFDDLDGLARSFRIRFVYGVKGSAKTGAALRFPMRRRDCAWVEREYAAGSEHLIWLNPDGYGSVRFGADTVPAVASCLFFALLFAGGVWVCICEKPFREYGL